MLAEFIQSFKVGFNNVSAQLKKYMKIIYRLPLGVDLLIIKVLKH